MSTQPQYSQSQMPAAAMPDDNRSLTNLRMELGEDVDLLKYIPYSRATFQPQNELQGAAPDRLLYGDMMEQKDQLWIYFTLLGGGRNYNKETGGNRMISFHTMKGVRNGDAAMRPSKVQDSAQPSAPFKFATNYSQVMAIAKYCFIKRGVDATLETPISVVTWKADLIAAGREYKALHEYQEARKAQRAREQGAPASSHMTAASREGSRAAGTPHGAPPEEYKWSAPAYSSSHDQDAITSRKRPYNTQVYNDDGRHPDYSTSSPSISQIKRMANERLGSEARDSLMEKYIELKTEQDDYDHRIDEAEDERAGIAAKIVGLQTMLDAATNNKVALMEGKAAVKAQQKELEDSLGIHEQLEFGFEAGIRMERKRAKRG